MNKKIPFFSLDRQTKKHRTNILESITKIIDTNQFVGGKAVKEFEENLAIFLNVAHAVSCNSGTDAIWMGLKALNIKQNDIIITTPFSFIASSSEIIAHKAHPVFIDIDKTTFNLDPNKITEWLEQNCTNKNGQTIENKTGYPVRGIITVNIFGQLADYKKIEEISKKWNLWILEDACQSIGAETNKQKSGALGNVSCFSFYPTKNLGAFGDGGCCTTNDPYLAEKLLRLRNHGRTSHYAYQDYGINSRLDGIQAAVLDLKLKELDKITKRRRGIAKVYNKYIQNKNIKTSKITLNSHVYHQYCIQVIDSNGKVWRDEMKQYLEDNNIGTNIFYPMTLSEIPYLNTETLLKNDCPIAEELTKTILALPIWPELNEEEILRIIDVVNNASTNVGLETDDIELKSATGSHPGLR